MTQELPVQEPGSSIAQDSSVHAQPLKEGDTNLPEQDTISGEILTSPNYQRFFAKRYFGVRLGSEGNEPVDSGKIDTKAVEKDALVDYKDWLEEQTSKERMEQEEIRRAQLEEQFFRSLLWGDDPHLKIRIDALARSKPYAGEYLANMSGTHLGDDPISRLESYGSSANDLHLRKVHGAPSLDEVESFNARFSQIREELEKDSPDLNKVDTLLAEFLHGRLEHFLETLDQRIERTAELWYSSGDTLEKRKELLQTSIYGTMRLDVGRELIKARTVMGSKGYKARALAVIGDDISVKTHALGEWGSPFNPDDFSNEPERQEELWIRQQAAGKYRNTSPTSSSP